VAEKFYGTPAAPEPTAPADWRRKAGPADEATRRKMLAEALKSKAPASYAPKPAAVKPAPKGGSNLRVEKALKDAGA
jgi:hypothetical protein